MEECHFQEKYNQRYISENSGTAPQALKVVFTVSWEAQQEVGQVQTEKPTVSWG